MDDKLYAGGEVEFYEYDYEAEKDDKLKVIEHIQELYNIMEVPFTLIDVNIFNSFTGSWVNTL